MKRIAGIILLLISLGAYAQGDLPAKPSPPKLVNDLTGNFLTPDQSQALEQKLVAFDDSTSTQITVVIVDRLGDYSADDYAMQLGRKWGVGNKDFNNGVVLLVSTGGGAGNRKVAIAVGYGLEGVLSDLTTKSIIDHSLVPNFRAGNYYRGLDEATDDLMSASRGRYTAPAGYRQAKKKNRGIGIGAILFFLFLIFLFAGRGGGGGGMVSRRGYRDFGAGWLLGSLLSGGRGGGGWSGGSGGWSGGGGGFGGFGGGSFGGGGSSGSW